MPAALPNPAANTPPISKVAEFHLKKSFEKK